LDFDEGVHREKRGRNIEKEERGKKRRRGGSRSFATPSI